ncbi:uncharacterized protein BJ212DRAFT_1487103 [Suillus subaureus]|uniref:Uncharacterized protein n=1 Tax=Suillus subaureus TaxID=48587 RepID=A0A9P7J572_9AGAM|nr:uncharacterized protein BJ212DRAFT_1487103 [Suillus subaureus]KAG1803242.1 hypothetical protein BJ212DRAFT_1487103 [Suillus subaureus]
MLFDLLVNGWIAAAHPEEHAGHMVAAKNGENAKAILSNTVEYVGQSVKILLAAANLG